MNFRVALITITVTLAAAAAAVAFKGTFSSRDLAQAEYSVSNLSCGSCVENIRSALGRVDGISEVEVSVTTGRSRVIFDPERIEASRIAEVITDAGYPSSLTYALSPEEYRSQRDEESRLAERFVARVNDRLIPREDFLREAEQLRRRSPQALPEGTLSRAAWDRLLQREILLTEAQRRSIVVADGEAEAQIEMMRQKMSGFDDFIASRYEDLSTFRDQIKTGLILERLLEVAVSEEGTNPEARARALNQWYDELLERSAVTILDPRVKAAVQQSGGCGGSCCG